MSDKIKLVQKLLKSAMALEYQQRMADVWKEMTKNWKLEIIFKVINCVRDLHNPIFHHNVI